MASPAETDPWGRWTTEKDPEIEGALVRFIRNPSNALHKVWVAQGGIEEDGQHYWTLTEVIEGHIMPIQFWNTRDLDAARVKGESWADQWT